MHRTQIATALGLPVPDTDELQRLAWDIVPVADAWIAHLEQVEWAMLLRPTPSRGRTLRNLTVNVFDPVSLLPDAFLTGSFEWYPEDDHRREEDLCSTATSSASPGMPQMLGWDFSATMPRSSISATRP
jgi:hypothetical protein